MGCPTRSEMSSLACRKIGAIHCRCSDINNIQADLQSSKQAPLVGKVVQTIKHRPNSSSHDFRSLIPFNDITLFLEGHATSHVRNVVSNGPIFLHILTLAMLLERQDPMFNDAESLKETTLTKRKLHINPSSFHSVQ